MVFASISIRSNCACAMKVLHLQCSFLYWKRLILNCLAIVLCSDKCVPTSRKNIHSKLFTNLFLGEDSDHIAMDIPDILTIGLLGILGIAVLIYLLIYGLYICFCYLPWTVTHSLYPLYRYDSNQVLQELEPEDLNSISITNLDLTCLGTFEHQGEKIPDPYGQVYSVNQDIQNEQDEEEMNES